MTLDQLREEVCEANRRIVPLGLAALTWGNVSGLADGRDVFAIKPSGVPYERLRPADMVVVRVATGEVVEGTLRPSSDTPTHREIYRALAGVGGITHCHSPKATAWAQARRAIPCFGTTHADHFYGPVRVTRPLSEQEVTVDYEGNTGRVIVETVGGADPLASPGVLVAGHAPFAWGPTASASLENAIAMEAVAGMALDCLALDPRGIELEGYVADKHFRRKHGATAYYGQKV